MTGTSYTERVGLGRRTLEWYQKNANDLGQRGLNASYWIAKLQAAIEATVAADAKQEGLKAELKATTAALNEADHAMYMLASGALDAAAGAYGKETEEGVQVARMRSKLHRPPSSDAVAVPLPVAPPPS